MFSLRTKLFALVFVGFTALIAAIVWQIGIQANKVAGNSVKKSLDQTSRILNKNISTRYETISEIANSLTKDGRILPLVYEADTVTLQDLSHEFKLALDFSILFFTDGAGTILARSDKPEAIGFSMAGKSPLFDQALEGQQAQGILASRNNIYQIIVSPILDNVANDIVRGTVALAYDLSPAIAYEIKTLTDSDIGFYVFERNRQREITGVKSLYNTENTIQKVLGQYFSDENSWRELANSKEAVISIEIQTDSDILHAAIHPLANNTGDNLGFVIATRSRNELLLPYQRLQRLVLIFGVISVLIASLLAWLIASRISKPIVELVSVTKNIEAGNYPDTVPPNEQKDEVGILYGAVMRMGKNLKDKSDLETYLAALSDDIGDDSVELDESFSLPDPTDNDLSSIRMFNDTGLYVEKDMTEKGTVEKEVSSSEPTIDQHNLSDPHSDTMISKPDLSASSLGPIVGETVIDNRYKVIRLVGEGAMGYVYLAQDLELSEQVAVKMLRQNTFTSNDAKSFREEIRLARKITHRNILRTFDFGKWDDFYYITMEYVHGYDLSTLLHKNGPLDVNIGIVMAKQICSAIDAAHEQNIIHRDLKPGNMLINRQGILKIMDFGLAMQIENQQPNVLSPSGQTLIAGTPNFMAPEQFTAGELDKRTDIYAVGIIIYFLLSGKPPFSADDYRELGMKHIKEPPPNLCDAVPGAPTALAEIINKALAKKPQDRYSDIKEMLEALNTL